MSSLSDTMCNTTRRSSFTEPRARRRSFLSPEMAKESYNFTYSHYSDSVSITLDQSQGFIFHHERLPPTPTKIEVIDIVVDSEEL